MGSLPPQTSPLLPALVPSRYESTGVKRDLGSLELCQVSLTPSPSSVGKKDSGHIWVFGGCLQECVNCRRNRKMPVVQGRASVALGQDPESRQGGSWGRRPLWLLNPQALS